ncbi:MULTISPECIES: hypothetical protein [Clostridium]|jgi:hypothetical protein|uniref:Uncharacterized protein n=1 Tax=Clostridium saccharoperbutylacetonicum N1-4(HMT) TaxID=931276 RepID=M1LWJ7_9CLOT|nr:MULTISPECIES: hypothetical protein [Clostridium]AGF57570.1 hypothetical protein Cspa_c38100 [Clostridium saccharoperbutylacetonicum N1-4(HMT)]NRT61662.1 hypothetical protein [Clostridium saccharoperbutylacetonicum]NSB24985.1 hypothetical protein [Clostridium saccharoperbutylacetonicum]NSB44356.1 hypothetical protein [Clostridium saccharoperbutylacetonicum]
MYLVLIAYIILWAAIIKIYGFDTLFFIGGILILISTIIGIIRTKKEEDIYDIYNKKHIRWKKKRK